MKLNSEQIRKLHLFSYNVSFLNISVAILSDYIYSLRACSFIYFSPLEVEILLTYSSKNVSKKKIGKLIDDFSALKIAISDFDDFIFFAKLIKDAYKFSDGIFLKNNILKQKKLYLMYHRYQEVLDFDVNNNLYLLNNIIEDKMVLDIHFKGEKKENLPFKNVVEMEVDKSEINDYKSWFEWFDVIKIRTMIQTFDIAFISLGIYSNLLNCFIAKTLNKIAITRGEDYD